MARLFSWLVALLFVASATVMVVLQTVDRTALNASYVASQFKKVDGYKRFSVAFSQYVTAQTNNANPQLPQSQNISITTDAAKLRFAAFFDQLKPYLKGKSSTAVLDFKDIIERSRIPAFPIPLNTGTLQPVSLSSSSNVQNNLRLVQIIKTASTIAAGLLLLALVYACYVRSRYRLLAVAVVMVGLAVGVTGLLATGFVQDGLHAIVPTANIQAVTTIIDDIAQRTAGDVKTQLVTTGAILVGVGLGCYVVMRMISVIRRT